MLTDLLVKNASSDRLYVEDVFSTWLYSGANANNVINNGIDLAGKGGLVWLKNRSYAETSALYDSARTTRYDLRTEQTAAQSDNGSVNACLFRSTGFTVGNGYNSNTAGYNYASWTFRKAPKFFDVVTWTGDGTSNKTVSHSLGSVPGFVIIKVTSTTGNWRVAARKSDNDYVTAYLNLTNAGSTVSAATMANAVNATTLNVGYWNANIESGVNTNGASYVAYLFAHDTTADGVIQCGSLSASSATTVTLGWEPQYVLLKQSSGAQSWYVVDVMRGLSYRNFMFLHPNASDAEADAGVVIEPTATGFTFKGANLGATSGQTYIYMAIRRGPMRTPTSGTSVFSPNFATASAPWFKPGFPTDLGVAQYRGGGSSTWFADRLRGPAYLESANTNAEVSSAAQSFAYQNGWHTNTTADTTFISWNFRRAPGFFDVVCYTGTGSARTVSHNLGVAPELLIVKGRSLDPSAWRVYASSLGATKFLNLHTTGAATTQSDVWNDTSPTSSVFTVGTDNSVNSSGNTIVAYLFASCSGVSKVGTYTGTGTTLQINCGFTNGARFVLIKRTNASGDWYVYDSARGIVSGNDPYLLLNSTAAEVTNTDYIDPLSTGFELSSTAPAALNANGGTYIYLAIA